MKILWECPYHSDFLEINNRGKLADPHPINGLSIIKFIDSFKILNLGKLSKLKLKFEKFPKNNSFLKISFNDIKEIIKRAKIIKNIRKNLLW